MDTLFALLSAVMTMAAALHPAPGDRVPPQLLSIPPLSQFYPPESLAAAQEGRAILRCRLPIDGRLVDCTLHQSSGFPALDEATFKLAAHALYSPLVENGAPRETIVHLPVRWCWAASKPGEIRVASAWTFGRGFTMSQARWN